MFATTTTKGSVYTWGSDQYGQLGIGQGTRGLESTPQRVAFSTDPQIVQVSCGGLHTLALSCNFTFSNLSLPFFWGGGSTLFMAKLYYHLFDYS